MNIGKHTKLEIINIHQPAGWYFNLDLQCGHFNSMFGNGALYIAQTPISFLQLGQSVEFTFLPTSRFVRQML